MEQFGLNLRVRAQELGLSHAEVARRVGIAERRFGFYVTGDREPDLATLLRIADVLQVTVDELLRSGESRATGTADALKAELLSAAATLSPDQQRLLADTANTFARHFAKDA